MARDTRSQEHRRRGRERPCCRTARMWPLWSESTRAVCRSTRTAGNLVRLRPCAWLARRAELPVDCRGVDRQGDRQIDRRSDDAGRGRTGPGDQRIEARHDEADLIAVAPSRRRDRRRSRTATLHAGRSPTASSPIRSTANGTTSCEHWPTPRRKGSVDGRKTSSLSTARSVIGSSP